MKRIVAFVAFIFVLGVIVCFFIIINRDEITVLPNGYKYLRLDTSNHDILDKKFRVVVDPNVEYYQIIGIYIVGKRNNANIDNIFSKQYGYFILNTRNHDYVEGMTDTEFRKALQKRGILDAYRTPVSCWWITC
jgi:hypothetical protein